MNLFCTPIIEIATYNEVFTIKGNSTKESMFRRIPQNGLKENIIIKQRKGKQLGLIQRWIKTLGPTTPIGPFS